MGTQQNPYEQHQSTILGLPMILVLPVTAFGIMGFVFALGFALGAFEGEPQNQPARDGLEGSSPFDPFKEEGRQ